MKSAVDKGLVEVRCTACYLTLLP